MKANEAEHDLNEALGVRIITVGMGTRMRTFAMVFMGHILETSEPLTHTSIVFTPTEISVGDD